MANHVSNQRNKSAGRKSQGGQSDGTRHEPMESQRSMSDMREEMSDYMSRGASQVREMTRDHEGTAVMVALAAGFGIGLLIGGAIAASHTRPQRWTDRIAAEGMGRRLMERLEHMMPEALTERFGR